MFARPFLGEYEAGVVHVRSLVVRFVLVTERPRLVALDRVKLSLGCFLELGPVVATHHLVQCERPRVRIGLLLLACSECRCEHARLLVVIAHVHHVVDRLVGYDVAHETHRLGHADDHPLTRLHARDIFAVVMTHVVELHFDVAPVVPLYVVKLFVLVLLAL